MRLQDALQHIILGRGLGGRLARGLARWLGRDPRRRLGGVAASSDVLPSSDASGSAGGHTRGLRLGRRHGEDN